MGVQRCVVAGRILPGSVEIVRHQVDEIEVSEMRNNFKEGTKRYTKITQVYGDKDGDTVVFDSECKACTRINLSSLGKVFMHFPYRLTSNIL